MIKTPSKVLPDSFVVQCGNRREGADALGVETLAWTLGHQTLGDYGSGHLRHLQLILKSRQNPSRPRLYKGKVMSTILLLQYMQHLTLGKGPGPLRHVCKTVKL